MGIAIHSPPLADERPQRVISHVVSEDGGASWRDYRESDRGRADLLYHMMLAPPDDE